MPEGETAAFRLTEDDLVAAGRLYAWSSLRRPAIMIRLGILWLVFVIFLGFVAKGSQLFDVTQWSSDLGLVLTVSAAPFVAVALITLVLTPIAARRTFRQQRSLQGELSYGWTASALTIGTEYGSFDMPWSHFLRWIEDDRTILLFESDRLYRVIPKRVLDPDQHHSLRQHLARIGT